ncbi:hypothetical protein [Legionella clemsonensis]|uniref:CDP-Glycerol:Poly(Glycerophosphate) glycerophosphotransferase n=1 Tax=Legionella clemsonensis TaxID=1867846 RepID=A0A222P3K9_9GAMM|nr:hypothetical protein [Legionella clemsonensis]ASQ46423.1 hypothetical protein clem_09365 [Legionella clemsonensis]
MSLNFIKKIINSTKKNAKPIMIFISSYTNVHVLSMLAKDLIAEQENILFIMQTYDENLLNKIKFFIPNFTNQYLVIDDEANEVPYINEEQISFENIQQKYQDFDVCFNTFKALYVIQYNLLNVANYIIRKNQPKILIVPEDGISSNLCLIEAATKAEIPVLDVPYGYGSYYDLENALAQKQLIEELYSEKEGAGQAVKEYYPHWVKSGKFAGSILLNPHFILALEELNLSVQNPWTVHGGAATKITVESQAMYDHYLNEGIIENKLCLTGTPYCDYLRAEIDSNKLYKEAFLSSKKIHKEKTSVLICWPPSYHAERANLCEYATYEELTKSVLDELTKLINVSITLSVHPAVQREFMELLKNFNVRISTDYILSELPKHDIYISCYSSTIRWAIAVAKPVINYDFYKFRLRDYQGVPGVLNVETASAFQQTVNKLITDEDYYHKIALSQKAQAERWGLLDGLNFKRIYSLIMELT